MLHRHLNHERFTLAALDDVIERGRMADWVALREAVKRDPALRPQIERVCQRRIVDPYAQRYHFWMNYVKDRPAA